MVETEMVFHCASFPNFKPSDGAAVESARVGVFTPRKLTNTTNQASPPFSFLQRANI